MDEYLARVAEATAHLDMGELRNAVKMIQEVKKNGNIVWTVGNGGSAATAEHFANDLVKMAGVRSIALPSIVPTILAYGNDHGWHKMFADSLMGLAREGDALVAISCSGMSMNVFHAATLFHHNRLIILTGSQYESPLGLLNADAKIFVPDADIRVQEDVHLAVCHAIAGELKCSSM